MKILQLADRTPNKEEMAARKPLEVTYISLTDKNVEQLRKINTTIFPVRYADKFYNVDVLKPEHEPFCKLGAYCAGATCGSWFRLVSHAGMFFFKFNLQSVTTTWQLARCAVA